MHRFLEQERTHIKENWFEADTNLKNFSAQLRLTFFLFLVLCNVITRGN
jgi:hypothetical protein